MPVPRFAASSCRRTWREDAPLEAQVADAAEAVLEATCRDDTPKSGSAVSVWANECGTASGLRAESLTQVWWLTGVAWDVSERQFAG